MCGKSTHFGQYEKTQLNRLASHDYLRICITFFADQSTHYSVTMVHYSELHTKAVWLVAVRHAAAGH